VTFTWNAVAGASFYEVALNGGTTWIQLAPGVTSYLVADLNPGQTVSISVRAVGQQPCQISGATSLTIDTDNPLDNEIFVPNTFTPNSDGKNDVLYVYGNSIAKLRLRIYNQWGEFIYESLNIQNGWDGTYRGRTQPNGVYVYQLEADFNDGTKATKKGTITLLR
jgi:gliding motility-associated-like protein